MNWRRFIIPLLVLILVAFFGSSSLVSAAEIEQETATSSNSATNSEVLDNPVTLKFFWGEGCPHCHQEALFLEKIQTEFPQLNIEAYEVFYNAEGQNLMEDTAEELGVQVQGVPFTVIGNKYLVGYSSDETTGAALRREVAQQLDVSLPAEATTSINESEPGQVTLPIFGEISADNLSLPLFTILVALVDGFNPCAMWTLIFLISLLLNMKDKKRMWLLGSLFIVASAGVYFLFLAAWFNFFTYFGYLRWIKVVIGLIALAAGGYYLKEAISNPTGACKVSQNQKRRLVFEKLKEFTLQKSIILAALGIMALAVAVNVVELACSAGLPAVYTQVLAMSNLPGWQHYAYLGLYILIFMIDDLAVFFIAMTTLKAVGLDGKFSRYSHWIGGILLLTIGLLLIFKPELLMLG